MTFECDISNGRWKGTTKVFDVEVLLVRARLEGKRITEKTAPPPFVAIGSGDWSLEDTKHTTHEKNKQSCCCRSSGSCRSCVGVVLHNGQSAAMRASTTGLDSRPNRPNVGLSRTYWFCRVERLSGGEPYGLPATGSCVGVGRGRQVNLVVLVLYRSPTSLTTTTDYWHLVLTETLGTIPGRA